MLSNSVTNLSVFLAARCEVGRPNVLVEDGQIIEEAGLRLQVIHTPGHTPGGISLYSEIDGVLFTGDALFNESIGRTDFPGGDHAELLASIQKSLLVLPEQTQVYPGHGPGTTIGWEKRHNPFLK
jgi:glyoxylase-like metal-dependent hydrolase (beta-lactamase superfamily II)